MPPIVVPFNREATQRYMASQLKNEIHNTLLSDFIAIYKSSMISDQKSYSNAHFKPVMNTKRNSWMDDYS